MHQRDHLDARYPLHVRQADEAVLAAMRCDLFGQPHHVRDVAPAARAEHRCEREAHSTATMNVMMTATHNAARWRAVRLRSSRITLPIAMPINLACLPFSLAAKPLTFIPPPVRPAGPVSRHP